MVRHMHFNYLYDLYVYVSMPSVKQQREMTKTYIFWRPCTAMANLLCLPLELNAVSDYILGNLSKRRQQQGHQTKGLLSKTIAVNVC